MDPVKICPCKQESIDRDHDGLVLAPPSLAMTHRELQGALPPHGVLLMAAVVDVEVIVTAAVVPLHRLILVVVAVHNGRRAGRDRRRRGGFVRE
jgi:hypothetical protein